MFGRATFANSMFVPALSRSVLAPLTWAWLRPVWRREHVPRTGAVILAANHLSVVDSFVIPLVAPRPVAFLAKEEYFTRAGVTGALLRTGLTAVDAVPVPRGAHRAARGRARHRARGARQGTGLRHPPGGHPVPRRPTLSGRTGVAWLALASGAPVVLWVWWEPSGCSRSGPGCPDRSGSPSGSARHWSSPHRGSRNPASAPARPGVRSPTRSWRRFRSSAARRPHPATTSTRGPTTPGPEHHKLTSERPELVAAGKRLLQAVGGSRHPARAEPRTR